MNAPATRARGRPKDESKRVALLDAARTLFLAHGLDVTTDEIAARAGVAKATLYANFPDKDALLEAVIRRESDLTITDDDFLGSQDVPIEAALLAFGNRFMGFLNRRDLAGWDRLLASAAARQPQLAKRFFDAGPERGQRLLTQMIASAVARGELRAENPEQATEDLTGLWIGFSSLRIKLGVSKPLTRAQIEAKVAHGVRIFLAIYGKSPPDATA